ncbi:hypothetical protein RN001_007485 [Aquatica leii]|uniref:Farnesol dehydrogenase-like n=1 Tax=Aquatica leii TaxID=1421715 RepID=A0AAN7P8T3_9COLE|nr:hypothetical protein RN001_007485 [Aquatica leii]
MAFPMNKWLGKVAVVTGASAGIGAAICEQLVESGLKVVGLARRKERVENLAKQLEGKNGKLYAFKADMTKEEDILSAFNWVTKNLGPIDVLINNVGIFKEHSFLDGSTKDWKDTFDTNVLSLCIATREAIKIMKQNKIDGHIVCINSIGGHKIPVSFPINVYGASKYAVTALAETLRVELNSIGSKIKISSVSPGAVKTELVASLPPEAIAAIPFLEPADVANAVMYILNTPQHVQIHDILLRPVGQVE